MSLDEYRKKRSFKRSPEPGGEKAAFAEGQRFVVQKHAARRLHYDFRLEIDGVLKSWAVPKGPSLDPAEKRLAVHVEDHPLEYADFEGVIPEGEYGAGTVIVWDHGNWDADTDLARDYQKGKLKFRLEGEKLKGGWTLVRMRGKPEETADNWLLIKERDNAARPLAEFDVLEESPESVLSGKTVQEIAAKPKRVWKSNRQADTKQKKRPKIAVPKRSLRRIPKSKPAKLPQKVEAQLARLADQPPDGVHWIHEIKFDGYRLLAHIQQGQVTLRTRNQNDWTERFPETAEAIARLPVKSAILDGEVVALNPSGISSFQDLQNTFRKGTTGQLVYQVFDLLYLDGFDLRDSPLEERKQLLADVLAGVNSSRLQYTDHIEGQGPEFFQQSCRLGLEGVISKRRDRPYRSGRNGDWIKTKCIQREEFVIGGYTRPAGSRVGLGALLVGYYDGQGNLIYAGRVGTGFSDDVLIELQERLSRIARTDCPFAGPPKPADRKTHWVEPLLVAQVEYGSWTDEGILRHASFQGLREDRPASSVVRESNKGTVQSMKPSKNRSQKTKPSAKQPAEHQISALAESKLAELANVRITSPDKVLYADIGLTKLALAAYYVQVSDWILPHLVDRPVSLFRCPEGIHADCFFQKHAAVGTPKTLRRVTIQEKKKKGQYLALDDLPGLASLVQIGVLEIHPWPARTDRIDRPDRMIFDLDPDESVSWPRVIDAALRVRDLLNDLGLASFVKTTGGKGLHVVVPIQRRHGWEEVKGFSEAAAKTLAGDSPGEFTANMSKAARRGKIYIDFQRNNRGATAIAPYSTRARPGAPVAVPLFWEELSPAIGPDHFHVGNVPARLAALDEDPWAELPSLRQSLTKRARTKLGL